MEEFKDELIKTYINFVYEGDEIVKFWDNLRDKTSLDKFERIEIVKKHCLEYNFNLFIELSYIIDELNDLNIFNIGFLKEKYYYYKEIIKENMIKKNYIYNTFGMYVICYNDNKNNFNKILDRINIDHTKIMM
jgi:hypothetical protein